jgi:hypothetical protein
VCCSRVEWSSTGFCDVVGGQGRARARRRIRSRTKLDVGRSGEIARRLDSGGCARGLDPASGEAERLRPKASPLGLSYLASHKRVSGGVRALLCRRNHVVVPDVIVVLSVTVLRCRSVGGHTHCACPLPVFGRPCLICLRLAWTD